MQVYVLPFSPLRSAPLPSPPPSRPVIAEEGGLVLPRTRCAAPDTWTVAVYIIQSQQGNTRSPLLSDVGAAGEAELGSFTPMRLFSAPHMTSQPWGRTKAALARGRA